MDTKTTYNNLSREVVESDDQSNSSSINYNSDTDNDDFNKYMRRELPSYRTLKGKKICLKSKTLVSTTMDSRLAKKNETNCNINSGTNSLNEFVFDESNKEAQSTCNEYQRSKNEKILDMLNKIYNQINGITTAVKENNYRISKLEETIGQLKTSDRIINNEPAWDFPIKNLEELDLFEDKLLNEHFKSNIVLEISHNVKDNVPASVRCILYSIFKDNVLLHFSYKGMKKKHSFKNLKSSSIIFDAVRTKNVFRHVPDHDIIKPIQLHLAQAKFRLEKKTKRQ